MKHSVNLAVLGSLTAVAISTQAQVIDFTAAQGYVNGPLHTQDSYHWWSSGAPDAWQVDTGGSGYATISSSLGDWKKITYSFSPFTGGYTGSFDFSFTLGTAATAKLTVGIFGLQDSAGGYKGPSFELKALSGDGFSMDIWNDTSSTYSEANVSGADIGMPAGIGTSADLRFGFTTTPVALNKWTTVLRLENLNTSMLVGSATDTAWTGQGWADVIKMEEAQLNTISGTGGAIRVDRISISVVPEPATGVLLLGGLAILTTFRRHQA